MDRLRQAVCAFALVVLFAGISAETVYAGEKIPAAYMNDIDEVSERFPATKIQLYNDCWAFSAVGLAEFDMIVDDRKADRTVDYSELQLAYFTYHHVADPFGGTRDDITKMWRGYNYLSLGGTLELAARSLLQWVGLCSEDKVPYRSANPLRTMKDSLVYEDNEVHLQNVYRISIYKDPDKVKKEIMRHGAAGIGLYVGTGRSLMECEAVGTYQGREVPTYYCAKERTPNHAVNIIGWDDDFPAENFFSTPPGNGAWLARNSWSESGTYDREISSYFWLSYYDKSLEESVWIYDFETADNYDYNYQYDGGLFCDNVYPSAGYEAVANVFQVQGAGNERLEAVLLSLMKEEKVKYTIKVYTDLVDGSNPSSGYLAATESGTTKYAGVHTISLSEPVPLVKGTKYAVVIELGRKDAGIDIEYGYQVSGMVFSSEVSMERGQSFVLFDGRWEDMADQSMGTDIDFWDEKISTGNWCIKAYTNAISGDAVAKVTAPEKKAAAKDSISISWDKVKGVSGYEVFRSTSRDGTYRKIADLKSAKKTSYKDTGLKKNKTYYYRVRAYKENDVTGGDGEETAVVTVGKMSAAKAVKTKAK